MEQPRKSKALFILGLIFPLLVIIVLSLYSFVPKYFVAEPKFDLVFYTQSYQYNEAPSDIEYRVSTNDHKIIVEAQKSNNKNSSVLKLYYYSAKTNTTKEINFSRTLQEDKWKKIIIPELEKITLHENKSAPDGYEVASFDYNSEPWGLMFYQRNEGNVFIQKSIRNIKIPYPNEDSLKKERMSNHFYRDRAKVLGWVNQGDTHE